MFSAIKSKSQQLWKYLCSSLPCIKPELKESGIKIPMEVFSEERTVYQEMEIPRTEYPDPAIQQGLEESTGKRMEEGIKVSLEQIIEERLKEDIKVSLEEIKEERQEESKEENQKESIEERRERLKKIALDLDEVAKDITDSDDTDSDTDTDTDGDSENQCQQAIAQSVEYAEHRIYFKARLEKAIQENKIFWMHFDRPGIQEGLERRGWIRKISSTIDAGAEDTSFRDPDSDTVVTLPYAVTPTFIWVHFGLPYTLLEEDQILNFFANINCFTSKAGLCVTLKRLRMFTDVNADTFFPRCYDLTEKKGKQLFVDDFMATAARSILKWVIRRNQKTSQVEETTTDGCTSIESVPVETILAAFKICKMCLGISENDDIDKECEEMDTDWTEFRERYYRVIHDGADIENSASHVDRCCSVLHKIKAIHPQLDIDGERNIWILKPAFLSQGRDIMCMNRLNDIIDHVEDTQCSSFEKRWVIQKYIERPLLIYETKFDVRQFFLVTDWEPLTIWFYKVNYIRFSSQPFNLENLDRSIHLCNRSIQKYLTNAPNRHPDLPEINVWSNKRMQEYLRMIGAEHAYEEVMMPGMKKALLHTLQACQDTVYKRENSFDFYGADFMFGEDFQPWLIEINFRPDLSSPSEVTEGIFKNLLEDILKVVLDRKTDPNCDTGAFELIQEQP